MENRFGFKELVISVLILLLMVMVSLGMYQLDRQWGRLEIIGREVSEQKTELARVRRMLAQGISVTQRTDSGAGTDQSVADAFQNVREIQQREDYAHGDTYVDSSRVHPPSLTPLLSSDVYASWVQARVLETLAVMDPHTLEWRPLLAESWEIAEQDDGSVTVTFRLRRGLTFSDGEPLTAEDVVFTYEWIMNRDVDAPRQRAYFRRIENVEKIDDYTVVFHYAEPYYEAFELAASMWVMPKHFYGALTPQEFNREPGMLLGSGQYRMRDPRAWRPRSPIELVRNERYWGEPGPFNRIIWEVIENPTAQLTRFRNGDLDIFHAEPEQYRSMIQDEQLMARAESYELQHRMQGYTYVGWNQRQRGRETVFADKRVRQAMTMLVDHQSIIDRIFLGYAQVATGPFNPLSQQSDPDIEPWPYDPDRARELLLEAGFTMGSDGIMRKPDGERFEIKLTYPASNDLTRRMVLHMRESFSRAGVLLVPDATDWPLMIQMLNTRDYQAITLGWSASMEIDIFQTMHSSQTVDGADNFIHYVNPELDALIDKARMTLDQDERMTYWREAHRIIHEDQPYTFLFRRTALTFIDKRIQNVHQTDVGLNHVPTWSTPMEWYVPEHLQRRN